MKTAAVYARYSSDNQTEQSIEGQLRVCEEYAQRNGIVIVDTYIDRAMTGTNDNRPDFRRMIKDSAKKSWDFILVYKLDRFSRNKYETAIHKKTLKDNGVKVLSAMENIPETPEGIILESLLEGMNQYFSAELSQKIRRGMRETRLKGNYQGGPLLYGYKIDGRKIVINETEAETVRYIFSEYSKGVHVSSIVKSLTDRGIFYKGKPFELYIIYTMLKNEKYTGRYRYGNDVFENMFPRIVSDELFERVRAIVEKNKRGKRSVKTVYLLRDKMICGYCGMPVVADSNTRQCRGSEYYYKCKGRKNKLNDCKKKTVWKEELERLVLDAVITRLNDKGFMDQFVQDILSEQEKRSRERSSLQALVREQKQIETSLSNIMTAIEKGVVNGTTQKRMKELEARQEELERLILIERSKQSVTYTEAQIREYYEKMLKEEPQALINLLVKQIVLYDDKIEIYFTAPIAAGPDDGRGFLFCEFSF